MVAYQQSPTAWRCEDIRQLLEELSAGGDV